MLKRVVLPGVVVFAAWEIMDFVIHNVVLGDTYAATAQLWRPEAEMKFGLLGFVVLMGALTLVYVYAELVTVKSLNTALKFSLVIGLGIALGMSYGTYSVIPLPYSIAFTWFLGAMAEYAVAGLIMGIMIKS
jgi:hypothetical protein